MAYPVRLARLAALLALLFVAGPSGAPASGEARQGEGDSAYSGTKIRKLHLVRPDLIPYPLAYEVLC